MHSWRVMSLFLTRIGAANAEKCSGALGPMARWPMRARNKNFGPPFRTFNVFFTVCVCAKYIYTFYATYTYNYIVRMTDARHLTGLRILEAHSHYLS